MFAFVLFVCFFQFRVENSHKNEVVVVEEEEEEEEGESNIDNNTDHVIT